MDNKQKQHHRFATALPYMSVLPLTQNNLDLVLLDKTETNYSELIKQYLLGNTEQKTVDIDLTLVEKEAAKNDFLKAIAQSFKDFRKSATPIFIGFPLVVMVDEDWGKTIAAPLFLWEVVLQEQPENPAVWSLSIAPKGKGRINSIIKSYLTVQLNLDWEKEIGLINKVDEETVLEVVQKIATAGKLEYASDSLELLNCPSPYAKIKSGIYNHLVLGHLSPQIKKNMPKIPVQLSGRRLIEWQTKVASLKGNPEQNELIGTLFEGHNLVVEGEKGTGKTHTIASLLASVLVDKGNVLIITPQESSANQIMQHLQGQKLAQGAAIQLLDEELGKLHLIERLKKMPQLLEQSPLVDNTDYAKKLNKHQQLRTALEATYEAINRPVFKGWNWGDTVGHFLQEQQESNKQILNQRLDKSYYNFTLAEWETVSEQLAEHYPYYQKLNKLTHAFNALNGRFFVANTTFEESQEKINRAINLYWHKATKLYHRYLALVDNYAETLKLEQIDYANRLEKQIAVIQNELQLYQKLYGDDFDKQSFFQNVKLKFLSIFSSKYHEILAAKRQLLASFDVLKVYFENKNYLKLDFPDIEKESQLADIGGKLERFRRKLLDWKGKIGTTIDKKIQKLTIEKMGTPALGEAQAELDLALAELVETINKAAVLREDLVYKQAAIKDDISYLLQVVMQFQKLKNRTNQLEDYYHWRKHWLLIGKETQSAVKALVYTNISDWSAAFNSWYWYYMLEKKYSFDLPNQHFAKAKPYQNYQNNLKAVQEKIGEKAKLVSQQRQLTQIKRLKKEKDISLVSAAALFDNKSLKDAVEWLGLEHFGEFFPIVIMGAAVAAEVLQTPTAIFDLIIIDDSQAVKADVGVQLLKLANQRIVLGQALEKEADKDSILAWTLAQKGRKYQYLKQVYQAEPKAFVPAFKTVEPTAFQKAIVAYLTPYIAKERIQLNSLVAGVLVDVLLKEGSDGQQPFAIIVDAGLAEQSKYDFEMTPNRTRILKANNYVTEELWSVDWWKNAEAAFQPLLAHILNWDKKSE